MVTKRSPAVFMQNSGFGNIINPMTSLNQIYRIPIFLIITWRGRGGRGSDAPEHDIVGEHMEEYLRTFRIPYEILTDDNYRSSVNKIADIIKETSLPAAVVISKGFFADYEPEMEMTHPSNLPRYEAINIIKKKLGNAKFISTTGFISRESFAVKDTPDFYMMGSMGMALAVAAGIAKYSDKRVVVLDGDGAILMQMGSLPFIGHIKPKNLIHIVLDNEAYASTKNQPTVSKTVDLPATAKACGYISSYGVKTKAELNEILEKIKDKDGPTFISVKVMKGNRSDIGRVSDRYTCEDITKRFMTDLSE